MYIMEASIYSSTSSSSENIENECLFCFENISKYDIAVIDCGHSYHYHCIQEWVSKTKKPTRLCPQCNNTGEIINIVEGKPIRTNDEMIVDMVYNDSHHVESSSSSDNIENNMSNVNVDSYLIYTNPPSTHPQIITDSKCCSIL